MIYSNSQISSHQIARHYDELDTLYRSVWGEHVHHGLFSEGTESIDQATLRLSEEVARLSEIQAGDTVCDIGCGYGGTARFLAKEYEASVLGITISMAQLRVAFQGPLRDNLQFRLLNWLENDLLDASFDHLIAIESSEHMPDKQKFFSEAARVVKPKGTFVICAWLCSEKLKPWEAQHLIEPICREGRLPSMGTPKEYLSLLKQHDFEVKSYTDVSHQVKQTWTLSLQNLAGHLLVHPKDFKLLQGRFNSNADFLKTLFRIRLAYETGAMKYGIFKAVRN